MPDRHAFPDGFLWGAATSAQQIEGGRRAAPGFGAAPRSGSAYHRAAPGRVSARLRARAPRPGSSNASYSAM